MRSMRRVCLILICTFAIFILGSRMVKTMIVRAANDLFPLDKGACLSTEILGRHIIGVQTRENESGLRILTWSKSPLIHAETLRQGEDQQLLLVFPEELLIYTKGGEPVLRMDMNRTIKSACTADINGDGKDEVLVIKGSDEGEFGDTFEILSIGIKKNSSLSMETIYTRPMGELKPWKVQTADVDGDGLREISIGVYKTTPFHPVMDRRPFIYSWNGEGLSPKWLGSRLSRPFDDYVFDDMDGDKIEELIAMEELQNGQKVLNAYRWKGFGFESMGQSEELQEITNIITLSGMTEREGQIRVVYRQGQRIKERLFIYFDGCLIEKE